MRQFHEIIEPRRKELGLTVEQVYARLELYKWPAGIKMPALASLGHWFNGTRKRPRDMHHMKAICEVLELQIGDVSWEESIKTETDIEQITLRKLRTLSPEDQELALTLIEGLSARSNKIR